MPYRILLILASWSLYLLPIARIQPAANLVVAWVENDDLRVWRTGDTAPSRVASAHPLDLAIAPDGQYIAYTNPAPASLWLLKVGTTTPVEIASAAALAANDTQFLHISNLRWTKNDILYFITDTQSTRMTVQTDDLWSVDAARMTFKQLILPPDGGPFEPNPDGSHILINQPGVYNGVDAQLFLAASDGQNRKPIFSYPSVSTASDYDFRPRPFWSPDSTSLTIAVPDKDLIYNDDTALTALWRLGTDGSHTQFGSVQASFFGQPQWSASGSYMAYLRHKGDITTNQFEMVIAAADGTNPIVYTTGTAGSLGTPQWLPSTDQFIYPQGSPGDYWLGQPDQPPQPLPAKMISPRFVDATQYVFATATGELRYASLGDTTTALIATVATGAPIFDAVSTP